MNGAVCADCFSDYAIRRYIAENATTSECGYCGKVSEEPIAVEIDDVLTFMEEGIGREYDIPENCLPYETSEGGWQLVEPTDSRDLVADSGWLNEDAAGFDQLFEKISGALSDRSYVKREPLILSDSERFTCSWEAFCRTVKHNTRFVIFKVRPKRRSKYSYHPDDIDQVPVYRILENIGRMATVHGLIRVLPRGTSLVRARMHASSETFQTAESLGSPPDGRASQSRMSPAGIAMFYGADSQATAFVETYDPTQPGRDQVTFGRFVTTRRLQILDLSAVPEVPSIFDRELYDGREEVIFLKSLASDISKPIARDGREHYEYVPTQVVAEYFRSVFRADGKHLDGIAFASSRQGGGLSYCIFTNSDGCHDRARSRRPAGGYHRVARRVLILRGVERRTVADCLAVASSGLLLS